MLPFAIVLQPGESPYRQVVFAATRAIVSGEMAPGTTFPSVRELSQSLKINPTTAHKVVTELIRDGLLVVLPGIGTVVAENRRASASERRRLLSGEVEQLVVEAKRLGLDRDEILAAIEARWDELSGGADEPAKLRGARSVRRS
jgi:GntR family transcriptional regulator